MDYLKSIFLKIISLVLSILFIGIIISTITFIGNLFSDKNTVKTEKTIIKIPVEEVKEELKDENEKDIVVRHHHSWKDSKLNSYEGNIQINMSDYNASLSNKLNITGITWGSFYKQMIEYDHLKINYVYKLFDEIYNSKKISRKRFADIIVCFVQKIPYSILVTKNCDEEYKLNKSIKKMIDNGEKCEGNVTGGIYTPVEFMKNFKGDCDTRTIFLYTILNHYNYDTIILNSNIYAHSIIGVNLPSSGRYKTFLGKRYYTWETTSVNWELGDLPAEVSNMDYWNVEL